MERINTRPNPKIALRHIEETLPCDAYYALP
ncbi:hypothetical protein BAC2_00545 [uncultured bacterium]|nr:hypothetical protein BAC2_00545 [uncultured bacterium]